MYKVVNKKEDHLVIGKPINRVDGIEKVTGKAVYTDDMYFVNMLYAASVYSPAPHCRIKSVDKSKALAMDGVVAVLTSEDMPNLHSVNEMYYMTNEPEFTGDVYAIVAAETQEIANKAAASVTCEYEELPCVFTVQDALKEDAPVIRDIGVGLKDGVPCKDVKGNIFFPSYYPLRKGNVEEGFSKCDVIIEKEYNTQFVEHAYIETEAVIADPDALNGIVTLYSCCQHAHAPREFVADALRIPFSKVKAVQRTVGGSFGGKLESIAVIAARASLLAVKTGRPVKLVLTREQSILESAKRHPFTFKYKIGATREGKILAFEGTQIDNCGAYCEHAEWMNIRAMIHSAGVYDIPNVKTDTYAVFTNVTPSGAFRGYSSPQLIFAQETLMEELATALDMNIEDLKRKNILRKGGHTATNQLLDQEVILPEMMEDLLKKTDFRRKRDVYGKQTGDFRKGIGLVTCYRGAGLGAESIDANGSLITVNLDGSVSLSTGLAENGQGLHTCFTQIAAEAVGLNPDDIFYVGADSNAVPDSKTTVASRGTVMGAQSVKKAGLKLRELLLETGRKLLNPNNGETVDLVNSVCFIKERPDAKVPLVDIAKKRYYSGLQLGVYEWFTPPELDINYKTGQGKTFPTYSYGCCVAEVTVDIRTGFVEVNKVTSAHDMGTVINPGTAAGQIYGGIVMGMGFGACEEAIYQKGQLKTKNLDTYIVPTAMDIPEMDILMYESNDPAGTYGAKSLGEPATEMVGAAVALAVSNAIQRQIRELPTSLENVLIGKKLR